MNHPITRQVDQVDNYFGTDVDDPYRWLEGPYTDGEICTWVKSQSEAARGYLDPLPGRSSITESLTALTGLPVSTAPHRRGDRWFRYTNDGAQEQLLLRVADTAMGDGRVLLDPNPLTEGSTTSIATSTPSPDGALLAYSYSESGSDWLTWRVREVATGEDLPDLVAWSKFCEATWLPDGSGFFYSAFQAPIEDDAAYTETNLAQQLKLHLVGTSPDADRVVFELPDEPQVGFTTQVTDDDRWLMIYGYRGTDPANRLWLLDLGVEAALPQPLIEPADAQWQLVASAPDRLILLTDSDAPRSRLVSLDLASGVVNEVVPERPETLESAYSAGGQLILHYLKDAHSLLTVHSLEGERLSEIELPGIGSLLELSAKHNDAHVHISFTSFTMPRVILHHDLETGLTEAVFNPNADGLNDVITEQVWLDSADGTRIPMFLVHRRAVTTDNGPHPTLLYGYGGFRISIQPTFKPVRAAFVAAGGLLAVPTLRGGGEYGAEWRDAGRLANKQNVFDDAIAAAEHLVAQGWTTSEQLACNGGSNGGLLVGALLTQRPDLFAAAVPEVGVLDLLRFTHFTIGWAWTSDYGDPERSQHEFECAYAYSPYHRIVPGPNYPPTMVVTSDHDDRVVPAHSYKFAARLQAANPDGIVLLRVELDSGHGAGRARSAVIDESTDLLAFISHHTGLAWSQ
jgi:prolyl oligopeptidase